MARSLPSVRESRSKQSSVGLVKDGSAAHAAPPWPGHPGRSLPTSFKSLSPAPAETTFKIRDPTQPPAAANPCQKRAPRRARNHHHCPIRHHNRPTTVDPKPAMKTDRRRSPSIEMNQRVLKSRRAARPRSHVSPIDPPASRCESHHLRSQRNHKPILHNRRPIPHPSQKDRHRYPAPEHPRSDPEIPRLHPEPQYLKTHPSEKPKLPPVARPSSPEPHPKPKSPSILQIPLPKLSALRAFAVPPLPLSSPTPSPSIASDSDCQNQISPEIHFV